MNHNDATAIIKFVSDMIAVSIQSLGADKETVKSALTPVMNEFIKGAKSSPGTGACICGVSPERLQATADRAGCTMDSYGSTMILDHRCPHHGEKAQPAVWGRHKEKELIVTPSQWKSLGITYTDPTP